ncbi:MAG: Naphthoate synthase, partial [uncultured Solirubrobacteraceae bacterium]
EHDMDPRGGVRGHPLRALLRRRRRHREDHDRPARGAQRLPPADDRGDLGRARARPRGPVGRRDRPHRRGPARVLLGRRPARPRRPGLRDGARIGDGALPRHRPPRPDPPPPEARRGDGRRLRDRRRPRPAPRLRPHDRRRQRALRSDRAQGRLLRRRLRRRAALRAGRPQEGQGDLVPLPAVRRAAGARHGPRQHRRPARRAGGGDGAVVPRDARALPLLAAAAQGVVPRRRGRDGRHPAARPRHEPPLLRLRGGAGGPRGLQGQAHARLLEVPEAPV